MSIEKHIENVFTVYKPKRKWDKIYWLVDVHGTIIPSTWNSNYCGYEFINDACKEVLRWISNTPDQNLILWTSSYPSEVALIIGWLENNGINVDYFNCNPAEKNTEYADFFHKPYFNILLDDKAGFDPETEWEMVKNTLKQLKLWRV